MSSEGRSQIRLNVVPKDEDILSAILKSVISQHATQVLVTGKGAYRAVSDNEEQITTILGSDWVLQKPPSAPTYQDMINYLQKSGSAIGNNPATPHFMYGPTGSEDVPKYLFSTNAAGTYMAAIYVIGLIPQPLTYVSQIKNAINRPGKASGYLEYLFSMQDNMLLVKTQEKLRTLISHPDQITEIALQELDILEKHGAELLAYESQQHVKVVNASRYASKTTNKVANPSNKTITKKWWHFW